MGEKEVSAVTRKKYTSKAFRAAVDGYFRSITRRKRLIIAEPDLKESKTRGEFVPRKTIFGHPASVYRQPLDGNGRPMEIDEYMIQPTITGLCTALGISKQTWSRYAREKGYRETVEDARLRIETHLQDLLMEKNSARGAQFSLEYNFGWTDKKNADNDADEPTQDVGVGDMPLPDKLALLREMGLRLPEGEERGEN